MNICTMCRREIKVGQRVIQNHIITAVSEEGAVSLNDFNYQHSDCHFDPMVSGPRYDDEGNVMEERMSKGYVKVEEKTE